MERAVVEFSEEIEGEEVGGLVFGNGRWKVVLLWVMIVTLRFIGVKLGVGKISEPLKGRKL